MLVSCVIPYSSLVAQWPTKSFSQNAGAAPSYSESTFNAYKRISSRNSVDSVKTRGKYRQVNAYRHSGLDVKEDNLRYESKSVLWPTSGNWTWKTGPSSFVGGGAGPLPVGRFRPIQDPTPLLLRRVRNQSVNLAMSIGEFPQTARMIASTARRLAGAMNSIKRGKPFDAIRALGVTPYADTVRRLNRKYVWRYPPGDRRWHAAAGDIWLELQFGWKPLLEDIDGMAKHLASLPLEDRIYRVSAAVGDLENVNEMSRIAGSGSNVWYRITKHSRAYRVESHLWYRLSSPAIVAAKSLGFTNPMALAWDALPLSFVVDWFLPIGPWLNTLDAGLGLTFVDGYKYHKQEEHWDSSYSGTGQYSGCGGRQVARKVLKDRVKISGFPTYLPRGRFDASPWRVTTSLALLAQAFGGSK